MEEQEVSIMMQPEAEDDSMEIVDTEPSHDVLPEHELQLVLDWLPIKDLKAARQVCKQWALIGGNILAKRSKVFMKTDEGYRVSKFDNFLKTAADPLNPKFMRYRDIELCHVYPGDKTIGLMLKSPCVKDSITSLRVHGPQLKWIEPVLPDLNALKLLGFDDTYHYGGSPTPEDEDGMEYDFDDASTTDTDGEDSGTYEATDEITCGLETLEVHINGSVRRNPLNWLLPKTPALKNIKLVIVNTNQLIHCVEVFRECYVGPGLKGLRISGSFGYTWCDSGEKIPDREGARALSEFLACPGIQGLRTLAIHAPCYPFEWRDRILNAAIVNSLISLEMDVYLRVNQDDFVSRSQGTICLALKETPRNPEPKDYLSAFPMAKDGITMPNLRSLKIDVDIRGNEVEVDPSAMIVLKTARIFPSLVELDVDVRMLRFVPVDITSSFSLAFPSLAILTISMSSSSLIRPLLLNLPRRLREFKVRSTTAAGKYDKFRQAYEIPYLLNNHRLTDDDLLDGEILSNFPELTDIFIEFNCARLTDTVVIDGFAKMPKLRKLSLGGPPEFTQEALELLENKTITFTSALREEY